MDVVVFGASGPTGLRVVRFALAAGHHVIAVTRQPDRYPIDGARLDVAAADVADAETVQRVIAGAQTVISTYGVPYSRRPITVYSYGITNIVHAMAAHDVDRLVCVSSTTVATDAAPGEALLWRAAMKPLIRHVLGRTLYDDMARMEAIVQRSDRTWTIVRPGGLFNADEPTDDYDVAPQRLSGHVTSRADLADLLVKEATEPRYPHAIVEVLTRSARPSAVNFLKEAFGGS